MSSVDGNTDSYARPEAKWMQPATAEEEAGQGYSRRIYRDATGRPRVETYLIADMSHVHPIDPGAGETQCGTFAGHVLPAEICASDRIVRFWGLAP